MKKIQLFTLLWSLAGIAFFGMGINGSGTTKAVQVEALYSPRFDFTPPEQAAQKTDLTLAMVNPAFAENFKLASISPFSDFSSSMANDFEEMLIARGYNLRGPFSSRDDMVFQDKQNSELIFDVSIDLTFEDRLNSKPQYSAYNNAFLYNSVTGEVVIGGKLNMTLSEPFSAEKIWKKSVLIEPRTINCQGVYKYGSNPSLAEALSKDPGIRNPIAKFLQEEYKRCLQLAWGHLDPMELTPLKQQVKAIREKVNYNSR